MQPIKEYLKKNQEKIKQGIIFCFVLTCASITFPILFSFGIYLGSMVRFLFEILCDKAHFLMMMF